MPDVKRMSIHWFRKGLRLHDNPALLKAVENACELRPIFILDPWFVNNAIVGINRWRFLLQTLQDLDDNLKKLGSRLFVIKGNPVEVFPKIFKEWNVDHLTFEVDTEPYAKERDEKVEALATEVGVKVTKIVSHTLHDTQRIIAKNGGKVPTTYQRFLTVASQLGAPAKPAPSLSAEHLTDCKTPVGNDHDKNYGVPTLSELEKEESDCGPLLYPGGETEALARLEKYIKKTKWICQFEKPKTEPNSLSPSTTVLSPYLKFGCVSARTFYWKLKEVYKTNNGKHSQPPVSLEGQLLWREFFYTCGDGVPNFDRMEGNVICKQIPWDNNSEFLKAWKEGKTGYPFIDAIMTQLRQEGWVHHLARHSVACFLTRGDLWVSWEEGQKVFEEYLLDADWSLNAGNWMWLSASSFFYQYFRVYSPIAFGKKTDKNGDYIKKYLPQLKKFPAQYIYEPWKAPLTLQSAAGCIIGKDYPKPIVDHDKVRATNIKRMGAAYEANKAGQEKGGKKKSDGESEQSPAKKRKL